MDHLNDPVKTRSFEETYPLPMLEKYSLRFYRRLEIDKPMYIFTKSNLTQKFQIIPLPIRLHLSENQLESNRQPNLLAKRIINAKAILIQYFIF